MKKMTCKQLGGACDTEFQAETFEEMADLSRKHGMETADEAHLGAMEDMKKLMTTPEDMKEWMNNKQKEFEELAED